MPLQFIRNDITHMETDAIVNAANTSLLGGGGVDGAIHRAAGPELLEACRRLNGCAVGQAKITRGYRLPCKYVIHTVGPIWQDGQHGEQEALTSCYWQSLKVARENGCESIAFPLISAGAYGYPKEQALEVAVETITRFLKNSDMLVYIVLFVRETFQLTNRLYREVTSYIDDVYVDGHLIRRNMPYPMASMSAAPFCSSSLEERLEQVDESFSRTLLRLIDQKGMTDPECYKRANVDRKLFHKIRNQPGYRPSKQTALAFAIALELTLPETNDLLMKAGFALSHSSKADIVVEYCIQNGHYNLMEINEILFSLDLQPLG